MTEHVSDLQIDRLLAGDRAGAAAEAREHAIRCAACNARLRALTAERDAFRLRPVAFQLSRTRRGWRWGWLAALVPAAAVAVAMIALWPRPVDPDRDRRTEGSTVVAAGDGIKGHGELLSLFAGRPGALSPVASGYVVHPGDYLQAGYSAEQDGFGAVLSCDGDGNATAYVPPDGDEMIPLAAGRERAFPHSTILDATLGRERIAIVWCRTPHPLAPLVDALRAGRPITAPHGCIIREVALDKRPASGTDRGAGDSIRPLPTQTGRSTSP